MKQEQEELGRERKGEGEDRPCELEEYSKLFRLAVHEATRSRSLSLLGGWPQEVLSQSERGVCCVQHDSQGDRTTQGIPSSFHAHSSRTEQVAQLSKGNALVRPNLPPFIAFSQELHFFHIFLQPESPHASIQATPPSSSGRMEEGEARPQCAQPTIDPRLRRKK